MQQKTAVQVQQAFADIGELGLLAFALAIEPCLGIGSRSVRVVAARLAMGSRSPLRPPEGGSSEPSLARKLFIDVHAATCVPSTEKCSSGSRLRTSLWFRSWARNLWATSASNSRSRFFVNTVGTQIGSSMPSPTNQRYSRL